MRYLKRFIAVLGLSLPATLVFAEAAPLSERMQEGEKIYRAACARCHDSGNGGAPLIGEQQSWKGRSDLWEAVLFEHAENGYLSMPAQGGDSRLTEYEAEAAAEFMVQSSFPERLAD